jgi:hypothetical protein
VPPPIEGDLRDLELGDEVLDRLAGEHPLAGSATKLGGVVPRMLAPDRSGSNCQQVAHFWDPGHFVRLRVPTW